MPVNLSIKNVPDQLADRLRARARASRRSLQRELLVILEEATSARPALTPAQVLERVRAMGLRTPDEAGGMIRNDRDRGDR